MRFEPHLWLFFVWLVSSALSAEGANISGVWTRQQGQCSGATQGCSGSQNVVYFFRQDGTTLTGTLKTPNGPPVQIENGRVDGKGVSFMWHAAPVRSGMPSKTWSVRGTTDGDVITLSDTEDARSPAPAANASYTLERVPFECPEEHAPREVQLGSPQEFIRAYASRLPNQSVRDLMLVRYQLLVYHSCTQTLNSMLSAISPLSPMLRFRGQNFGPATEEFDPTTGVWTVRYTRDGKSPAKSDEDLILNFYGWKPPSSASAMAATILHEYRGRVLWNFEAPDDRTKARAFFIWLEMLPSGAESDGEIYFTKVTSIGVGAYGVTFMKKFSGTSAQVDQKIKTWILSQDGQATALSAGRAGVDSSWEEHFASKHK